MLCQEVASYLQERGHDVRVLTSTYGLAGKQDELGVYRRLALESDPEYYRPQQILRYWSNTRSNRRIVQELLAELAPDVILIWGMWDMSHQVAAWCEELAGSKVAYYLADVWPSVPGAHEAYWDDAAADGPFGKAFKAVLRLPVHWLLRKEWRPFELRFEHVAVCSQAVRDELVKAGIPVHHAKVIYHGIDPVPYQEAKARTPAHAGDRLNVVYVGALLPHKGVHTAIEAISHISQSGMPSGTRLTILGSGHSQYELRLRELTERLQLQDSISFHAPIARSELPAFLAQFDVLVMPSVYEEPQARISQEAMATGLVLVATLTGGTKEILVDGENGLAFKPEDAEGLGAQLRRLAQDADLRHRLALAGQQTAAERFTITRMIDELELYLAKVASD